MPINTFRVTQTATEISIAYRGETVAVPRTCSALALMAEIEVQMWTRPDLSLRTAVELAHRNLCAGVDSDS